MREIAAISAGWMTVEVGGHCVSLPSRYHSTAPSYAHGVRTATEIMQRTCTSPHASRSDICGMSRVRALSGASGPPMPRAPATPANGATTSVPSGAGSPTSRVACGPQDRPCRAHAHSTGPLSVPFAISGYRDPDLPEHATADDERHRGRDSWAFTVRDTARPCPARPRPDTFRSPDPPGRPAAPVPPSRRSFSPAPDAD
jgi:hypothetical protein